MNMNPDQCHTCESRLTSLSQIMVISSGGIEGIGTFLGYEAEKEKAQKDFDERFLLAQNSARRRF